MHVCFFLSVEIAPAERADSISAGNDVDHHHLQLYKYLNTMYQNKLRE